MALWSFYKFVRLKVTSTYNSSNFYISVMIKFKCVLVIPGWRLYKRNIDATAMSPFQVQMMTLQQHHLSNLEHILGATKRATKPLPGVAYASVSDLITTITFYKTCSCCTFFSDFAQCEGGWKCKLWECVLRKF